MLNSKFAKSLLSSEMPQGWSLEPVGTVLKSTEYGLSEPTSSEGNVPIVGMKDLVDGVVVGRGSSKIVGCPGGLVQMTLASGDILLNRTNSPDLVGKVGIVRDNTSSVFASYLVRLNVDPNRADPEFVNYWLNSRPAQVALKRISTRAISQANVNPTEFKRFCPIALPPLEEQRKIAEILRAWDEAIEATSRLIAAKRRRYAALSRHFFEPCHPTENAQRSNEWREFLLGDVFSERVGGATEGERLLSVTMRGGVIDRDEVGRKDVSTEDKSRYKLVLPGDIAYNTMRMWQGVSGLSALRGIVSPAYTVVTPDEENIRADYATHLFKSRRMVFDFERYSQGLTSDTWNLKFPAFAKIRLFLPPIELQQRHSQLLDGLLLEIDANTAHRKALQLQKRGLMQKLLTGKWRVSLPV